jgi:2-dehydropantoate 2-reductase
VPSSPSIAIFGAGAVGCYLGGKLAANTDSPVTLIGRPALVAAVQEHGLVVREQSSTIVSHPDSAASTAGLGPYDLVILTVRAYDVVNSIPAVRALMGDQGLLLAMQNGVGSEESLAETLGSSRVLAGTLTASVLMAEPGIVVRRSEQDGIALAAMNASQDLRRIANHFVAARLPTVVIDDYHALRWSKLLLNMLGATVSAILDIDMATLATNPRLFRLEQLAFREAGRVMDAQHIRAVPLPGYPVPLARLVMRTPRPVAQRAIGPRLARSRGGDGSSPTMRSDMDRGRSEVSFLNGAIVATARELRIQVPVNTALTELTEELVHNPERREPYRGHPERLLAYMRGRGIAI